jgi:hypothetical protein
MTLRRLAPALLLIVLALPATGATTTRGGLYGTVTRGPTRPVCNESEPCDGPAEVTLVFKRLIVTGILPVRVRTTATGHYKLYLHAGYYAVTTTESGPSHWTRPARVHVRRGHLDRIDFSIDTGIR